MATFIITPGHAIIAAIVALYAAAITCWIVGCVISGACEGWRRWRAGELKLAKPGEGSGNQVG